MPGSPLLSVWRRSHRFDPAALPLADRHYNRRKVSPGALRVAQDEAEKRRETFDA